MVRSGLALRKKGVLTSQMNFSQWTALSENEQRRKCQYLDPYDDRDLFKSVENAFWEAYGGKGLTGVQCGLGPFIGPYNCLVVDVAEAQSETNLPEVFLGFPVIAEYDAG